MMLMLLLISSTPLFAQIDSDTTRCYNKVELQHIASRMVRANECDTLLSLCELDVIKADSIIMAKDSIIFEGMVIINSQDAIIEGKQGDIDRLLKELAKRENRMLWTKIGWVTTTVLETAIIVYLIIKP
jgi:hypothetical protein